ncbi:MAG: NYN domain-containing protein [Dechloromonas sp.]|nr:MAG: NYN domain-containing protein [Dechloromonas sp.]
MAINDTASMALFCDFENIALGVRDAQYEKFDIRPVLERLLAKGSIVVKKAYCDWERYKGFKAAMHEANFELIEIPHVRQSGKNSADIRMVVDALDLCYTKSHVDTFVIISGDSDFSPLVSKLRENAKRVIGVGVKQSCSDLLVTNCDEFIYYDDLVRDREARRPSQRRDREPGKRAPEDEAGKAKAEERKSKAVDLVAATFADLMADRGESERIWASVLKEVVKRRNPGFSESYYGFRSFGNLLEEAATRGLLGFGRDDKGAFVTRFQGRVAVPEAEVPAVVEAPLPAAVSGDGEALPAPASVAETPAAAPAARRRGGRRTRKDGEHSGEALVAQVPVGEAPADVPVAVPLSVTVPEVPVDGGAPAAPAEQSEPAARSRGGRARRSRQDAGNRAASPAEVVTPVVAPAPAATPEPQQAGRSRGTRRPRKESVAAEPVAEPAVEAAAVGEASAVARKPRSSRGRKPKTAGE